jgi:hypothetical protein
VAQQSGRHQGLAAARRGCGEDQPASAQYRLP